MSSESNETRTRILQATWEMLEENQGSGVRMADIAGRAGLSRQAVYLHFNNRSELLIATTRYLDEVKEIDQRLAASRAAATGIERLAAFIEAWGNYIPEIHNIGRALLAAGETDEAGREAWADRMAAVREGCAAAVAALKRDGNLNADYPPRQATDLLWTMLSLENWKQLTSACGWTNRQYVKRMQKVAAQILVKDPTGHTPSKASSD